MSPVGARRRLAGEIIEHRNPDGDPHFSKLRTTGKSKPLEGKRIAILLTDGVEQSELTEPRKALEKAGAKTILISPAANTVQAMKHKEKGDAFKADRPLNTPIPTISTGCCCPAASRTRTNCVPTLTR
jgi:hypothetical protein